MTAGWLQRQFREARVTLDSLPAWAREQCRFVGRDRYADDEPQLLGQTVHEADEAARRTGLLDAEGRPLVRRREPIGYLRGREWR